jgi:hypothetical protein
MPFIVPTFNSTCNIWHATTWNATWPGVVNAPDLLNRPCQLRASKNVSNAGTTFLASAVLLELVILKGTDIRNPTFGTAEYAYWMDRVEVPSGSSSWYFVVGVGDIAKGFTNEYRQALLVPSTVIEGAYYNFNANWPYFPAWPVPYP